jgi:hypothetical protein
MGTPTGLSGYSESWLSPNKALLFVLFLCCTMSHPCFKGCPMEGGSRGNFQAKNYLKICPPHPLGRLNVPKNNFSTWEHWYSYRYGGLLALLCIVRRAFMFPTGVCRPVAFVNWLASPQVPYRPLDCPIQQFFEFFFGLNFSLPVHRLVCLCSSQVNINATVGPGISTDKLYAMVIYYTRNCIWPD